MKTNYPDYRDELNAQVKSYSDFTEGWQLREFKPSYWFWVAAVFAVFAAVLVLIWLFPFVMQHVKILPAQ